MVSLPTLAWPSPIVIGDRCRMGKFTILSTPHGSFSGGALLQLRNTDRSILGHGSHGSQSRGGWRSKTAFCSVPVKVDYPNFVSLLHSPIALTAAEDSGAHSAFPWCPDSMVARSARNQETPRSPLPRPRAKDKGPKTRCGLDRTKLISPHHR